MASVEYNGVLLQNYQGGFEEQERLFKLLQRRQDAEILILKKIPNHCCIINEIKEDEQKTHQSFILSDMIRSLEYNYEDIITKHDFINQNPETLKICEAMTNALIILKSSGIPLTFTMEKILKKLISQLTKS